MGVTLYDHCLETRQTELLRQWDTERNGELVPQKVFRGSHARVWWRCGKGHSWQAEVRARTEGKGCPVCAGKAVLVGENDLAHLYPDIAAQWHTSKNGGLLPTDVTAYSNRRVWWRCHEEHQWQSQISHRTAHGSGCPYCAGKLVMPGFNDLASREPELVRQWHKDLNGDLLPESVTCGSRKKVWWQCEKGHVWHAVINSRTTGRRHGCPVCAGKVKTSKQIRYDEIQTSRLRSEK